ncbi:ABC transporter permease [Thermocatellispora tengchongensis]
MTTDTTVIAPESGNGAARKERISHLIQQHGALMVLFALIVVGTFGFDSFATPENAASVVVASSFTAIIAIGMTFVIISGGIDLSVGSLFVLGGVLAAWGSQYGAVVALLLPLLACGAVGLAQGLLIARTGMAPFIVTLAGLLGVRGLMLAISDEGATTYLVRDRTFAALGQGEILGLTYPVYITIVLALLGMLLLQRTGFGQNVYAIGGNEQAAALMGVPVARTKVYVYLMSGLLAGLAEGAERGPALLRRDDPGHRAGAGRDRRGGHRRDAADGRRGRADRHDRGRAAAGRDPEPDQPGRQPHLLLPAGRQRRVPRAGGDRAAAAEQGATAVVIG